MAAPPVIATGATTGADGADIAARAADEAAAGLAGAPADLAVVFVGAGHAGTAESIRAAVSERLRPRVLLGVTTHGVLAGAQELEVPHAVVVWAAALPGVTLTPVRYAPVVDPVAEPTTWADPPDAVCLLLLADPFSFPTDGFLAWAAQARPGLPVSGGMASGAARPGGNRLLLDDAVHTDGAVGVALDGPLRVRQVVSQGCRPVGRSWVVTRSEGNVLQELAGASALERIRETFSEASPEDQALMQRGLHLGIVIDEYREEFERGDFLVRGVLGAQQRTGAVVVGDVVDVGRTVQFHVRDASSADEDLRALLAPGFGADAVGALLFTCNGRGTRLFGTPHHDAAIVSEALGGAPLAGFFCAGELGPIGGRSFVHGFTASLLVIGGAPVATQM
jgi:small ligand-binding sensory domain FIST